MDTKFCIDCRHCVSGYTTAENRCAKAPHTSPLRFVDPKFDTPTLCYLTRSDESQCGSIGAWFEPSIDALTEDDSANLTGISEYM